MNISYPPIHRGSSIDDYHGHKVPDPYRWLEDPTSNETKEFIQAQNNLTFPYLESCPYRAKISERLTQLWDYPKYGCPLKAANNYFFNMNTGLQNQSVMYKMKHLDAEPEVFIDPNTFSNDGTIALVQYAFSEDGKFMAYAVCDKGSDWRKIKIRSTTTHEDLPDLIINVKYSCISWTRDSKGFFYNKYDNEDDDDGTKTAGSKFPKLHYHKVGTDQSEDILCIEFPDEPEWKGQAFVSHCGQYAFIFVSKTCQNQMVYYVDLKALPTGISGPLPLTCLVDNFEAEYSYVTNDGPSVVFHTNKNAPLYKVVTINLEQPEEANWVEIIPEDSRNVLEWVECVNEDKLLTCYIEDVKSVLGLCDLKTGNPLHKFDLDLGQIGGVFGRRKESEIFFDFSSFLNPGIVYYCDLKKSMNPKIFKETTLPAFDASNFKTEQIFYSSKDGTKIPMFLVHKKDFIKDGSAPVYLTGYGGFNISYLPSFSVTRLLFIQHFNGVLALPNIRGGGEYGEKWHEAGCKFNKQNVFDDFQAAAEYLIENKYTNSKKLTIIGGSNGGLLICACINQRPELYGCAISLVGVLDMLQYHKFTIGHAWKCDYCCADDSEEDFKYLMKISPYHNVKVPGDNNVQYPAVLLVTGDHDDRVVPLHSLKFIAELQSTLGSSDKQTNPLMIRVDTKSGHGYGKPTTKIIEEYTDIYCFICNTIGLKYED